MAGALLIALVPAAVGGAARASATGHPAAAAQSWPVAGQNLSDTHGNTAETAISAANVSQLTTQWSLTTAGDVTATPTVADGVVYFPDRGGKLWAVRAATGKVIWSHSVPGYTGVSGDLTRVSPAITGSELILGDHWENNDHPAGARLYAVSRSTGKLLWLTKVDTNPVSTITGSPVVYNGVAYVGVSSREEELAAQPGYKCCTFRGEIVAVNVTTGKLLWKTYTVPSNNGGGDINKPGAYAGGSVWGSSPVIDPANGMIYVGTGNDYTAPPGVCYTPGQKGCKTPVATDYFDSILGLKLSTGAIVWADRTAVGDAWVEGCKECGVDADFGSMPNLFTTTNPATGQPEQLLGAGQKSGVYWAVNPATGKQVWHTQVGPGGTGGGIEWGSATNGTEVFCAEADSDKTPYTVGGSGPYAGEQITSGSWAGLDAATGKMIWQTPDPKGAEDPGYVSVANGVVYAGSDAVHGPDMYGLDASTGNILWSFASGGEVRSGAAIVGSRVYWGSGYLGGNNDKFYAFALPSASTDSGHPLLTTGRPLGRLG